MFASVPESVILSLFDNVDDLTSYCLADAEQKTVIVENVIAKLAQEGKNIPGAVCNLPPR